MSKIVKKMYYAWKLCLASPLNVSSGISEETDADVLRNWDGEIFIPGTSVAGAVRDALKLPEEEDGIMGYSRGEEGRMSRIFISDIYFEDRVTTGIRDGICLDENKSVKNKFDMEIVETGAVGTMYVECIVRENEDEKPYIEAMKQIVWKLQQGEIRFGANKNRGFGRIRLSDEGKVYVKEFSQADERDAYLKFVSDTKNLDNYESKEMTAWLDEKPNGYTEDYSKISVPLKLTGGISIRRYSAKSNQADYEHITCNGEPVIPGSSWNGAIRADAVRILRELGTEEGDIADLIDNWFGKVSEKDGSMQSLLVVGESVIKGAVRMPMTRNKINRFDASTVNGALYSEISYFGGTTTLELMVRKDESRNPEALCELLQIVIRDIEEGFVPVGGQTAVGRGIFAPLEEKTEKTDIAVSNLHAVLASKKGEKKVC